MVFTMAIVHFLLILLVIIVSFCGIYYGNNTFSADIASHISHS